MMRIGVKGRRLGREEQRPAVLTFLVDASGSMDRPDRIGLVKQSLRLLVGQLGERDQVAIVQYGSQPRLVLEHTPAASRAQILAAIDSMQCGGSTDLEAGLVQAYRVAAQAFVSGAENRVLLLSDGVATMGEGDAATILEQVSAFRKQGVTCSVYGFGVGNYDDVMLETLANKGDGVYTYVGSAMDAKRVFVDDLGAALNTIAKDVKIQVEYNPAQVARYRQVGYENRQLRKQDFRDDTVDAGEVGSGQSVTALYELELSPGGVAEAWQSDSGWCAADVIAIVRVRYRRTSDGRIEEIEHQVRGSDMAASFEQAPVRYRLAVGVAEFAEILRGSPHASGSGFEGVLRVLRPVAGELTLDQRVQELVRFVRMAPGMSRGGFE
jgi:Ca-activated chloride channel family protein